jgi:hypothetical protein
MPIRLKASITRLVILLSAWLAMCYTRRVIVREEHRSGVINQYLLHSNTWVNVSTFHSAIKQKAIFYIVDAGYKLNTNTSCGSFMKNTITNRIGKRGYKRRYRQRQFCFSLQSNKKYWANVL